MITAKLTNRRPGTHKVLHPASHEFTRGEMHRTAKLTEAEVRSIHARYAAGETASNLAAEFDIRLGSIQKILRGLMWKHLNLPYIYRKPNQGLPLEVVEAIRQKYLDEPELNYRDLAEEFGYSSTLIRNVITGKSPKRLRLTNIARKSK